MSTRTGLKFIQLANGTVQAHYKTHSPEKVETIEAGMKDRAYTVRTMPLLHTNEFLLIVTIGKHLPKQNYDAVCADFKAMWREMREEQKAAAVVSFSKTFDEMEQDFETLGL